MMLSFFVLIFVYDNDTIYIHQNSDCVLSIEHFVLVHFAHLNFKAFQPINSTLMKNEYGE